MGDVVPDIYPYDVDDQWFAVTEAEAEQQARKILARMDPNDGIGDRHHTVPRFLIERFSTDNQVAVRDIASGKYRIANIRDLAVRDFYTFIAEPDSETAEPFPDGRLEKLLADIEGRAASVLRRLDEAPTQLPSKEEKYALACFAAFQFGRGVRTRVQIELLGEYWAKTMLSKPDLGRRFEHKAGIRAARKAGRTPARGNRSRDRRHRESWPTEAMLRSVAIRPHPNESIRAMGQMAKQAILHVGIRPVTLVDLDQPLLMLADEPLVVIDEPASEHQPDCFLTDRQRQRRLQRAVKAGREVREVVHLYPTRPSSIAVADQVAMAISPTRLLLWGKAGTQPVPYRAFEGENAIELADDLNRRQLAQAYLWIAARLDHPTIQTMTMPGRTPVFGVCDARSAASEAVAAVPQGFERIKRQERAQG